jgi:ubiquitin C-terminal hydrolase
LDLSLDISRNKSVQESLEDMFCRAELLSVREGNGWRPDKNSEKVDALKGNSLHVAGLPMILQLHLLRFHFDWQTERMSKIHDSFEFPLVCDL